MKNSVFLSAILILFVFATCRKPQNSGCFKGRLELKGICMNYTIKVLEGTIDPSLIEANWKDDHSGRTHQNVFGLKSVCTFPENIAEGQEFYFKIADTNEESCAVCKAYYPTPAKKLSITVLPASCKVEN